MKEKVCFKQDNLIGGYQRNQSGFQIKKSNAFIFQPRQDTLKHILVQ